MKTSGYRNQYHYTNVMAPKGSRKIHALDSVCKRERQTELINLKT